MTRWAEFPLRPQGQSWPGLNTRGGRLDPGQGWLEDGSFNGIINESDILEKRKGIVRGLDERFNGPVCGLFRYTDNCGVEYLVVADQDGIHVRTPFNIPVFLGSDSLPNDDFSTLDSTRWSPTEDYESFMDALQLNGLALPQSGSFVAESRLMQWFKPSVLTSYQTEIDYFMVASSTNVQVVAIALKKTTNTFLQANVVLDNGDYRVTLELVQSSVRTTLGTSLLEGATLAQGFLRLSYNAITRTATARVIPSGGSQVDLAAVLSEAQDANLGQNTAIGISRFVEDQIQIGDVVSGGV